jgi:serine/threonine-protein kinase RsbW
MSDPVVIGLDLPAEHQYLNIAGACVVAIFERLDDVANRDAVSYGIQLAVQETCTNIVDHAYTGMSNGRIAIELTLLADPRRMIIDILDAGHEFDPSLVREPDLGSPQVRGYGLYLMRKLMDEVIYERQAGRNHWHLAKRL